MQCVKFGFKTFHCFFSDDETGPHLKLEFPSAQAAINFINKHRWEWSLDAHQIYPYEPKTGGNTFWNNRNPPEE